MKQEVTTDKKEQKISNKDLRLLNDLHAALQKETHHRSFAVIIAVAILIVVFVVWSYFSPIDEVARGQGSIIPNSREQVIQSLDPGIISEMLVKEGDTVEKGQVLLKLDDTRSSAVLRESQAKVENLQAQVSRLQAEAYGTALTFPDSVPEDLQERERSIYNSRKTSLNEAIKTLQSSKAYLDREIKMTLPMVDKGAMSEVELLRMRRQSADLELQIIERQNRYVTDANNELTKMDTELLQAKENMAMRADPVERSMIRAPLKGIIKNIKINTIGGVVGAGQDIMEIVPIEDNLLVEAYIKPRDVAYVTPGMAAVVKLTAYDYAIYGGLDGVVTLISPDTLYDQQRQSDLKLNQEAAFYRVLVRTNGSHLTDKTGKEMPIIPGMIASVDIQTGKKTVFEYLTKPLTRMKQALQER
ncbi:hemolysin A secretion protein HlyD [Cricetibacter osteomyelitidis]|uniref:Hemolysin A secretion protein HlyD n=1 Tax=Cricetibacter osteomyelitidis TaxID=1521931 RepID=A0A4R2SWB0_9PAST|nr:HlyD family efflux transporter periplasmic adaptor subunit [Cricetibacter osteomyelitidis]TCP88808.1 hemolysin A secretion protein HlyD [Cricetibacter osteomyelitidis]